MKHDKQIPNLIEGNKLRFEKINKNVGQPIDPLRLFVIVGDLLEICEMQQAQINELKRELINNA